MKESDHLDKTQSVFLSCLPSHLEYYGKFTSDSAKQFHSYSSNITNFHIVLLETPRIPWKDEKRLIRRSKICFLKFWAQWAVNLCKYSHTEKSEQS